MAHRRGRTMTTPLVLASSQQDETALPGRSGLSSISGDGSLVTFTNLTTTNGIGFCRVYLKDLTTGDLTAIGTSLDEDTEFSRISGDGSTIVFEASPDGNFFNTFADDQVCVYNVATQSLGFVTVGTSGGAALDRS
jgi:Tol biopolymer transport system component